MAQRSTYLLDAQVMTPALGAYSNTAEADPVVRALDSVISRAPDVAAIALTGLLHQHTGEEAGGIPDTDYAREVVAATQQALSVTQGGRTLFRAADGDTLTALKESEPFALARGGRHITELASDHMAAAAAFTGLLVFCGLYSDHLTRD